MAKPATCIEVCHTYAPDRLVPCDGLGDEGWNYRLSDIQIQLGQLEAIESALRTAHGLDAQPVARLGLLDDVAAQENMRRSQDSARHALFLGVSAESLRVGAKAEVHLESAFVRRGVELQGMLAEQVAERALPHRGSRIEIPTSAGDCRVKLAGFRGVPDSSHPSCAVLDLAWTEWRTGEYGSTYTVLPLAYREQQLQVAALAALIELPRRDSVTAVFLDRNGAIVEELNFGSVNVISPRVSGTSEISPPRD